MTVMKNDDLPMEKNAEGPTSRLVAGRVCSYTAEIEAVYNMDVTECAHYETHMVGGVAAGVKPQKGESTIL